MRSFIRHLHSLPVFHPNPVHSANPAPQVRGQRRAPSSDKADVGVGRNRRRVRTDPIGRSFRAIEATSSLTQALIQSHKVEPFRLQQLDDFLGQRDNIGIRTALSRSAEIGRSIPHVVVKGHECRRGRRGTSDLSGELIHHVGDLCGGRGAVLRRIPVDRVEVPGHNGAARILAVAHALQHSQAVVVVVAIWRSEARGYNATQDLSEGVVQARHLVSNIVLIDGDDVSMTPRVTADLVASVISSTNNTGQIVDSREGIVGVFVLPVETVDEECRLDVLAVQVVEQTEGQNRRTVVECQSEGACFGAAVSDDRYRLSAAAPSRLAASTAVLVGEAGGSFGATA